ncbi:MAG: DUF4923 family protein [Prevotella sp.]|nr:DUF4923 family protein [Prevotella sp.]
MKKFYSLIVAAVVCVSLSSCGGALGTLGTTSPYNSAFSGDNTSNTSGLIGNLISTFAGGILTNQATLVGTWNYAKPCVQFESQNLLAQAGGTMAATTIENKLATYYQKIGLTPGKAQFVFGQNGQLQYTIGGRTMTGKYAFDANKRTVTITTQAGMNVTAYVSISLNQMALTFDASKMLSLVNSASAAASTLSNLTALTGSFSGMKLGFTFSK